MSPHVINFRILLPHMYGDINKLCSSFVELVFFYFIFAHNIQFQVTTKSNISENPKSSKSRALQDISEFSHFKPKSLNTAQVFSPNPSS